MASLNKVTLIGNVGGEPELRSTSNGKEIATLSIATSEHWKDKATGERKEKTEWHRVVVFNDGLVGIIKSYVKKGSKLFVEGSLQTRKWTDQSGVEKYTTEIILQNYNASIILLDSKNSANQAGNEPAQSKANNTNFDHSELDDEIPF